MALLTRANDRTARKLIAVKTASKAIVSTKPGPVIRPAFGSKMPCQ
jgi:hypothetical protein